MQVLRIMIKKEIQLAQYSIYLGSLEHTLPGWLEGKSYSSICLLIDLRVYKAWKAQIDKLTDRLQATVLYIEGGEAHKNLATCEKVWKSMLEKRMDRKALMINIGGGMTGDLGGFVAATYKRGIAFVQVPTTSLAMVDASIGGKLGFNFSKIKNSIGLFKNPDAVFINTAFLSSLPQREKVAGLAEVLKHALIFDLALWNNLTDCAGRLDNLNWEELIYQGILVKKHFVEKDPFEKNIRKALNFGHTIGHALESWYLETSNPYLHGEAVAMGMVAEGYLSYLKNNLSKSQLEAITGTIQQYFPLKMPSTPEKSKLLELMENDKKNDGFINFSLIGSPGSYYLDASASREEIFEAIDYCFKTFS